MFMHPFPFAPHGFDPSNGAPYPHDMPMPYYSGYPPVPSSWPPQQPPLSGGAYPMSFQRQPPTPAAPSTSDRTSQSSSMLEPRERPSPAGTEPARSETLSQSSDEDDDDGEDDGDQRLSNDAARGVAFLSINALGSPV